METLLLKITYDIDSGLVQDSNIEQLIIDFVKTAANFDLPEDSVVKSFNVSKIDSAEFINDKTFIASQILVNQSIKYDKNSIPINDIGVEVVIRKVIADNLETAIGKFVIDTANLNRTKKLNIECFSLLTLKTIQ